MPRIARDIMTPHIKSVPESWTVQKFAAFLSDNQITGSPVINEAGKIVGIATLFDIADFHLNQVESGVESELTPAEQQEARALRQLIFEEMSRNPVEVRDIMTPKLVSVAEETRVKDVAKTMMAEHVHRVFIEKDQEVVGIVTTYDLLQLVAELDP